MRPIKYQFWDSKEKVMGQFPNEEGMAEIADFRGMTNVYEFSHIFQNSERYTFRQSLGIKDDQGAELYEGDVVFFSVKEGVDGDPGIMGITGVAAITDHGPAYGGWMAICCHRAKKIGNIYENPELNKQPAFDDSLPFMGE